MAALERLFLQAKDTTQDWVAINRRITEKSDSFEVLVYGGACDTGPKLCGTSSLYIDNINMEPYIPVSTKNLDTTPLQLLGNPVLNRLRAILPENSQAYQIIDIQGQVRYTGIAQQNRLDIDIGNLSAGVYLLLVERRDSSTEQALFVKQ